MNGSKRYGYIDIDGAKLKKAILERGGILSRCSIDFLKRGKTYLANACDANRIYEDVLFKICEHFDLDPQDYIINPEAEADTFAEIPEELLTSTWQELPESAFERETREALADIRRMIENLVTAINTANLQSKPAPEPVELPKVPKIAKNEKKPDDVRAKKLLIKMFDRSQSGVEYDAYMKALRLLDIDPNKYGRMAIKDGYGVTKVGYGRNRKTWIFKLQKVVNDDKTEGNEAR